MAELVAGLHAQEGSRCATRYFGRKYLPPFGQLTLPVETDALNSEKKYGASTRAQPLCTASGVPLALSRVYNNMPNRNSAQTLNNLGKNPEQTCVCCADTFFPPRPEVRGFSKGSDDAFLKNRVFLPPLQWGVSNTIFQETFQGITRVVVQRRLLWGAGVAPSSR